MLSDNDNNDDNDGDDHYVKMIIQGDGGGPLVACAMDGNCGTIPGQNYDLIGIHIEIILISIVAILAIIIITITIIMHAQKELYLSSHSDQQNYVFKAEIFRSCIVGHWMR